MPKRKRNINGNPFTATLTVCVIESNRMSILWPSCSSGLNLTHQPEGIHIYIITVSRLSRGVADDERHDCRNLWDRKRRGSSSAINAVTWPILRDKLYKLNRSSCPVFLTSFSAGLDVVKCSHGSDLYCTAPVDTAQSIIRQAEAPERNAAHPASGFSKSSRCLCCEGTWQALWLGNWLPEKIPGIDGWGGVGRWGWLLWKGVRASAPQPGGRNHWQPRTKYKT